MKTYTDMTHLSSTNSESQLMNCSLAASSDETITLSSKEETEGNNVIEEIITDAAMTLEGMQHIVMETTSDEVLQQQIIQSAEGMDASVNGSVQIPMGDNTTLLIEHFAGDGMVVPQVMSQTSSSGHHDVGVSEVQHDQMVTTLVTEPQVTEVYMIIPTSDREK